MVRSTTRTVTVSMLNSELSMVVDRLDGPPGNIAVRGALFDPVNAIVIPGETVELWVNGSYKGYDITDTYGTYSITHDFPEGTFDIYTSWDGNDTYLGDATAPVQGVYGKIPAAITMSRSPSEGAPPLTVTIDGYLSDADSLLGLGDRRVRLYRDGVEIDNTLTKPYTPGLGYYVFTDVITETSSYYVEFEGDDIYSGCEEYEEILPCTKCGHSIPLAVVGAEVECQGCHSIFETVIV